MNPPSRLILILGLGLILRAQPGYGFGNEVIRGFTVSHYPDIPSPRNMAFDPNGVLYVTGESERDSPYPFELIEFYAVPAGGGSAEDKTGLTRSGYPGSAYSDLPIIFDPSAQHAGRTGHLLAALGAYPPIAVAALLDDGTFGIVAQLATTSWAPTDMALDSHGRLLILSGVGCDDCAEVFARDGSSLQPLFGSKQSSTKWWDGIAMAVGAADRILISTGDTVTYAVPSVIRVFDAEGRPIDEHFASTAGTGQPLRKPLIRFGRGGAFGSDCTLWTRA